MVDASMAPDAFARADTGPADAAGRDAARRGDAGPSCGTPGSIGGPCASGECFSPAMCQEEIAREVPSVRRSDGMPGRPYPANLYPRGFCERRCDPNGRDDVVCNSCSSCVPSGTDPRSGARIGTCYPRCMLDRSGRGGCNEGYGCNRAYLACLPSCTRTETTDTCQYSFEDHDDNPDTQVIIYDEGPDYPSRCNMATGLCETTGRPGATAGDNCDDEFDCENDGFCLRSEDPDAPATLRDGYCIRVGCDDTTFPCQSGDICTQSLFGLPGGVCMHGCQVGAETTDAQRYGPMGGNPGCGPNEACFWSGVHGRTATANGACYPGNYNDVPAYNVGAECRRDEDCWSPFGLGRCLFAGTSLFARTGRGICAIGGCGADAMGRIGLRVADGVVSVPDPDRICQGASAGNNDICVQFSETTSFCVTSCGSAGECPAGWACPDLGGNPLRPLRLCWPECFEDGDCRAGATCRNDAGRACNRMVDDSCFCSDATPAPDAGMMRDAGVSSDAAVGPDAFEAADASGGTHDAGSGDHDTGDHDAP